MKNLRALIAILSLSCFTSFIHAKDLGRRLEKAENYFRGGNFTSALSVYLDVYKADTTNYNVCYKVGVCYLKSNGSLNHSKALPYLKKAAAQADKMYDERDILEKRAPIISIKVLADAHHLNYEFDQALFAYDRFKKEMAAAHRNDREILKDVTRRMEWCNNAKELMSCPAEVKIVNLGKNVNSPFADYAPRISADQSTMIFTSRRPENTGGKTYDGGQYFEDIYISYKKGGEWGPAVNIGHPINTVGNEAAIGISADGQEILIYKDDMGDGNIYSSRLEGDKWTVPVKLNNFINSPYWEPAAFLSADGQTLYFISDRPGGRGGTDIYKSKRTSTGDWGRAINLGPTINTPFDEHAPFIHPDGRTLFFSSRGHKSMGGYDVFFSTSLLTDDKIWLDPINVGYPINTPADDAFYSVAADKQKAFYSSVRDGGFGEKDNYMITFLNPPVEALSVVKGNVTTPASTNMTITVTDNETNQVIGVYYPNSKTGKFAYVVTPGKSHNIAYESDNSMFYSENQYVAKDGKFTETDKPVQLQEIVEGARVTLNNLFFDFDQAKIRKNSVTELERLYAFLLKHPEVTVEIAGYADAQGDDEYNRKLSLERAKSVVSYLTAKGIPSKQLHAAGYGASNASRDKSNAASDRRVELKVLTVVKK
jgi:outer membrane protein OmpA-like peptidoglycan-associated protein